MSGSQGTRSGRVRGVTLAAASILAVASLSGCQHAPRPDSDPAERIVWPRPPDAPRFEYVQSIRTPRDMGIGGGWLRRAVRRALKGKVARGMARPYGVAAGTDGTIAVADPDGRSVHLYDPTRSRYHRLTRAGDLPLLSPVAVAFDAEGRLYVADSVQAAVFRFDARGRWVDTPGKDVGLVRPTGLACDRVNGRLYVVDTLAHRIVALDPEGREILAFGRRGTEEGAFNFPVSVAVGPSGEILVSDSMNHRVQIFDREGRFVRSFGRAGRNPGELDKSKGVAVDPRGHIYVVDALHDVIQVFDGTGRLLTVIGSSGSGAGEFWLPAGIDIDAAGRIFVADSANHRIQVLRYLPRSGEES